MTAVNKSRYRVINFITERILEPREMNLLQSISQGYDATGAISSYEESAMYRQGALLNTVVSVTGLNVSFNPVDNTQPMQIFIRDRWEQFLTSEAVTTSLGSGVVLYLNWEIDRVTLAQDSDLQDLTTGEPTAEMGQLVLSVSATDNSGTALNSTQLAKNTSPIILCQFVLSGGVYTISPIDNVLAPSKGNATTSGLVRLTTSTSGGIAVAADDPSLTNSRPSADGSVHDSSVRTPVSTGTTNADGTPQYNLSSDIGGISAAKIILTGTTQLLSDGWALLNSWISGLVGSFNAHFTAPLGLSNTHPLPTASQIGAAPISHVGQPLGLATSHPAEVDTNSGGFSVHRSVGGGASDDPAFGVFAGSTLISCLDHSGDVFSSVAGTVVATPQAGLWSGALGAMSTIAYVLAQHVNQVSHANPHGLAASDIGAASTSYVDSSVANILAAAESYTRTVLPVISINAVGVAGGTFLIIRFAPNINSGQGNIEVAIGTGTVGHGGVIPLPNGNYSYGSSVSGMFASISASQAFSGGRTINNMNFSLSGFTATCMVSDNNNTPTYGTGTWTAVAWRLDA